jgi:hypothetical protein
MLILMPILLIAHSMLLILSAFAAYSACPVVNFARSVASSAHAAYSVHPAIYPAPQEAYSAPPVAILLVLYHILLIPPPLAHPTATSVSYPAHLIVNPVGLALFPTHPMPILSVLQPIMLILLI